jgi:hypothetical protein
VRSAMLQAVSMAAYCSPSGLHNNGIRDAQRAGRVR